MLAAILCVFVIGYLAIALEHQIHITLARSRKLHTGRACWIHLPATKEVLSLRYGCLDCPEQEWQECHTLTARCQYWAAHPKQLFQRLASSSSRPRSGNRRIAQHLYRESADLQGGRDVRLRPFQPSSRFRQNLSAAMMGRQPARVESIPSVNSIDIFRPFLPKHR